MNIIEQSMQTVKYRLGKMPDKNLDEIAITSKTRDIFCATEFDYKKDKDLYAAISGRRIFGFGGCTR